MRWTLGVIIFFLYISPLAIPDPIPPLSDDEMCLAWVIKDEARGEPMKGKRAVLDVVLKRMEKRKMTACEVVKQPKQFSGYKQGMEIKFPKNVSEKDLTILYEVRMMDPVVKNSEYFHAEYVKPNWKSRFERIKQIGKHIFYRNSKEK